MPSDSSSTPLSAAEQELADCYSLMNEANPVQVRRGGATRCLWLLGEITNLHDRPDPEQLEAVLRDVEDFKLRKFLEFYTPRLRAGSADASG